MNSKYKNLAYCGLFTAIIAILTQLSIPLPSGIPITLQTFAVALTGFFLKSKYAVFSVVGYILLGAVGIPVFSGFRGGLSVLFGYTGGFLFGFIPLAFCCGARKKLPTVGLIICHIIGILQYSIVANVSVTAAFITVSAPFIIKDAVSVFLAYIIKKRL